ncbi:hypothetical protein EPUS_05347 [Endocarpon pusillum Z07020]|uniref:Uncharacterized protein n=1 Tax=Endocarpon pusillum (strain Z07020 / HMAS-L-300199) TaxID=1263415 RepID=U1HWX8_ENDPU|nr:uncharacterized protein EPUS_05347 [Endocarpon pusillum Z07020]ERF73924.1 hypothetical protein EPUS_05347 [Endocarpon pusillum Z07020]
MPKDTFSAADDLLDEVDEAGLYILCRRKKGDRQQWMLALIMEGERFGIFYYYEPKSDGNGEIKVAPDQVWNDENLVSKHFLKSLTYPHLVGHKGFHNSAMSVRASGNDKSYIVRVLLILEQRFLVPDRSYSDWNEIWRYPPSSDGSDSGLESFTTRESELLARYPANNPATKARQSPASRKSRSPTPAAQAGPSSDLALKPSRASTPATPARQSAAPVRDRPGIDTAEAGPSCVPALDPCSRAAKKARSTLQNGSPKTTAPSTVQSGPLEVRPRSTVRTDPVSRRTRFGFQSPIPDARFQHLVRGDTSSSSGQSPSSSSGGPESDLATIGFD